MRLREGTAASRLRRFAAKSLLPFLGTPFLHLSLLGNPDQGVAGGNPGASYSVARVGTLVFVSGNTSGALGQRTLMWADREGRQEDIHLAPAAYTHARLSPDGTRVALDAGDRERDIWVFDLARESLTRLTVDPVMSCLLHAASVLWNLGYPEQSARRMQQAMAVARRLEHPFSLAHAHRFAAACSSIVRAEAPHRRIGWMKWRTLREPSVS